MAYDLLMKNGRVVNGSRGPSFSADVAVHHEFFAAAETIPLSAIRHRVSFTWESIAEYLDTLSQPVAGEGVYPYWFSDRFLTDVLGHIRFGYNLTPVLCRRSMPLVP